MQVNSRSTIIKSAGILALFTLLSRIVGLYRDHLFAGKFGAGDILDAYYVAFRIPDLVFNLLILGTLSVAFIPVFTQYFVKDQDEANEVANTILSIVFASMSVLCLILFFFVPEITRLTAPGFSGQKFDNTVMLTKIFLLSPIIFTVSSVFGSVLNSLKRFVLVSLAPIIYNFGIIFGIVYLYPRFGIRGLAYGVVLGALLHLAVQALGALAAGFKIKPSWNIHHPGVKKNAKLFVPRILGIDSSQISLLVASIIGSTLVSGTVTAFNLANNIQAVAVGMFGISFATAAFPDMSEAFSKNEHQDFGRILTKTIVNSLFFLIPISVLLIILRAQIVRVAFGSGQFDWQATKLTANMLGIFAISIFAQGIAPLFSRAFYARHNTIIPVVIGLISLAFNAGISIYLAKDYGAYGLIYGFSISNILNAILLYAVLHMQLEHIDDSYLLKSIFKICLATVLGGFVAYAMLRVFSSYFSLTTTVKVFTQGLIAGCVGLAVFFVAAVVLDVHEAKGAISIVKRRLFR